jgi:hypothetical protein
MIKSSCEKQKHRKRVAQLCIIIRNYRQGPVAPTLVKFNYRLKYTKTLL